MEENWHICVPIFVHQQRSIRNGNWKKIRFDIATRKIKYLGITNQGDKRPVLRKLQNTKERN